MQLRDAAEALGVHYQTAYGWVRNGALPARKTPRGYQVSDADVHDLLARRAAGGEPPQEVQVRDWAAPASRLYAALAAGEETRARHDLGRLAAGVPLAALCDQVIAPALRRVGAEWAAGTLPIAVEHRATAICEGFIAARARPAPGRPRGVAVTATPPGERHALPALMAAACLRENHWQVHHLAADLPVTEVIALAAGTGASLIVLSSATTSAARAAAREAREIRERLPNAQVLAGHPGDTLSRLRQLARPSQDASGRSSTTERQDDDGLTPRVQQRHSRHRRTRPQCRVRSRGIAPARGRATGESVALVVPTRLHPADPAADAQHQLIEFPPPAIQVYAEASGHRTVFCALESSASISNKSGCPP